MRIITLTWCREERIENSIAVPSYNYGRFLKTCLESIHMQDHNDYEVLITDGGSKDDSLK